MAKPDSSKRNGPSYNAPSYRPRWVAACLCLMVGVLLTVALAYYAPDQVPTMSASGETLPDGTIKIIPPTGVNPVGKIGAMTAFYLFRILGGAAWLIGAFFFWLAFIYTRGMRRLATARAAAMMFCLLCACGLADMQKVAWGLFSTPPNVYVNGPGGMVGQLLYARLMEDTMGIFGSGVVLSVFFALSLMFVLTKDLGAQFDRFFAWIQSIRENWKLRRLEREEIKKLRAEARAKLKEQALAELKKQAAATVPPPTDIKRLTLPKGGEAAPAAAAPVGAPPPSRSPEKTLSLRNSAPAAEQPAPPPPPAPPAPATPAPERGAKPPPFGGEKPAVAVATVSEAAPVANANKLNLKIVAPETTRKAAAPQPTRSEDYIFPTLDLLKEPVKVATATNEAEHFQNAETLLRTLGEFGVEVSLGEIHTGPVITRYEVMPAPGVRVEKIASLDKNIALGMKAQSVRILAPVPGKGVVGVEVPNQKPTPVGMREILESADWGDSKAELPIALGKDVSGAPIVADLARMPHLLIAGATGSGKSVCVNSIVASLVYHAGPKKVRLLMVDPKIVELQVYNSLPHMLIPVVTEPKKVPGALKWLLAEMEKRYQIFAKCGVRNIASFNTRKASGPAPAEKEKDTAPADETSPLNIDVPRDVEIEIPEKLPYIVCIIDELADLMMVAPAEIETSIARLAQLARAAGIHLIVATQRPSVNIITGSIKANLPSRIAFQVTSKVDSRVILDEAGADQLIGRGDLLFMPPGTSRLVRAQGAFISDEEIARMVEHLKKNGPPAYRQEVQEQVDRVGDEDGENGLEDLEEGSDDDLLPQAIDVLKSTRRASTSMLQRRLRIGYNRAARLMELMEQKGIVGPENGAQPREILADLDRL
ncbi:MAG TPA: DNA translocase FtsK 4TM domain-containing protein [Opitutaceae bacterium]|nr:DNA translocase FtsK 4TM domain-containing protein [Opitutaceae bacterium]